MPLHAPADFKSCCSQGDFREGTDIGLIGDKKPVFDISQRSRTDNDRSQQHRAQKGGCRQCKHMIKAPAQRIDHKKRKQHRAQIPCTSDKRLAESHSLQKKQGREPAQKIIQAKCPLCQKLDDHCQSTGQKIIRKDRVRLVAHKL